MQGPQASLARLTQRLYSQQLNSVPQGNGNVNNIYIAFKKKILYRNYSNLLSKNLPWLQSMKQNVGSDPGVLFVKACLQTSFHLLVFITSVLRSVKSLGLGLQSRVRRKASLGHPVVVSPGF